MSTDKDLCEEAKRKVTQDLGGLGFSIHEDEPASTSFFTLGGEVDGEAGQIRMTAERAWDLIRAFEYAASHPISPSIMQKLLGHAMFFSTLHRGGMSVFRSCYDFIEKGGESRMLNRRERQECTVFAGLIPLLYANIRRPWSEDLFCTDASPQGYGICERQLGCEAVGQLGRWNERWRFRRLPPEEWAPRRRAMGLDPIADVETVLGDEDPLPEGQDYVIDDDFPEVPLEVVDPSQWKTSLMGKWRTGEHITLKEGRALVLCLRRLVRSSRHRNKRHVILVDNLGLALSISKGRAKDFRMLRIAQQVAALSFLGSFTLRLRWIPSERNVSDGPSRGKIRPGPFQYADGCQSEQGSHVPSAEEEHSTFSQSSQGEEWTAAECNSTCEPGRKEASGEGRAEEEAAKRGASSECLEVGGGEGCWKESPVEPVDNSGTEVNLDRGSTSVSIIPSQVREFLPGQRVKMAVSEGCRRHSCRFLGRDVPRQPLGSRRREGCRSSRIQQREAQRLFGEIEEGTTWLAQGAPSPEQVASPSSCGSRHGYGAGEPRAEKHGFESHAGSRHLPTSWRKHRHSLQGRHPTSGRSRKAVSLVRDCGERYRGSEARQSRHLRQHHCPQQSRQGVLGRSHVAAGEDCKEDKRVCVSVHCGRVQKEVPGCRRTSSAEESPPISMPSRRSIRRLKQWRPRLSKSQDKRSLAYGSKRQKVCQDGEDSKAHGTVISESFGVLSLVTEKHREGSSGPVGSPGSMKGYGWPDVLSFSTLPQQFGLELFAGTARICSAFAQCGLPCFPIDICLFPSHNVFDISVEHQIVHLLLGGRVKMVWLGMPCTSFSQARKWDDNGPDPLRDYDNIYGYPWLSHKDRLKVLEGNNLLRFSLRLLAICERLHIPYALENPYSSFAWHMPPMKKFIKLFMPYVETLDYCQFGEDWKKSTTIMGNYWNLPVISKRCTGTRNICSATGRPHVPLAGKAANGLYRTLLAQPYPWALADLIAGTVSRAINT